MKNKTLLEAIAKTIGTDVTKLTAELETENGNGSLIEEFGKTNHVFTTADLDTKIANAKADAVTEHFNQRGFDIHKHIPSEIHKLVKGSSFETFEKELAAEHGITDFKGAKDLVAKVVAKISEGKGKTDNTDLLQKIKTLEESLKIADSEVTSVRQKYVEDKIAGEKSKAVESISLDYEEGVIQKQRELLVNSFSSKYKIDMKDDKPVVIDVSTGKLVDDRVGNAKKLEEVIADYAKEYGFKLKTPDPGGRGTGSSQGAGGNNLKGKDFQTHIDEINKGLPEGKKMVMGSKEMLDKFSEWQTANQ